MGTATVEAIPQWYRMTHKHGGYAGSFDWKNDTLMFVSRGGTAYIDLKAIREEMQRREAALTP